MFEPHVCLCHRNRLLSECLASVLNESGELACSVLIPQTMDLSSRINQIANNDLALLLLDVTLDEGLSDQVIELVRKFHPNCKLVLLVGDRAVGQMLELARFGSQGYLCDDVALPEVRGAIQAVLAGNSFCSPQLANALMAQIGQMDRSQDWSRHLDSVQLTSREREVLELIAWEHLGNKQIARRLNVSLYTVKNHVHNIIEKLGVEDRHEAVLYAKRRRLLVGDGSASPDCREIRSPR